MNTVDVTDALHVNKVVTSELEEVLLSHFGRSEFRGREREYHRVAPAGKLVLRISKEGRVKARAENIANEEIIEIGAKIRAACLENQTIRVSRLIAYTWRRVDSVLETEYFQMRPWPGRYSTKKYATGLHPFVLEFPYRTSASSMIGFHRRFKAYRTLADILGVLLSPLVEPELFVTHSKWVYGGKAKYGFSPCWRRVGFPTGRVDMSESDSFTVRKRTKRMPEIEPSDYYKWPFGCTERYQTAPSNLNYVLYRISRLSEVDATKFQTAVSWHSTSSLVHHESRSSSFLALVSAIEALLPEESSKCTTCGQPLYRLRERFSSFLTEFAAGQGDDMKRVAKQIYDERSKIGHGALLHTGDSPGIGFELDAREHESLHHLLSALCRVAIINWVSSRRICESSEKLLRKPEGSD